MTAPPTRTRTMWTAATGCLFVTIAVVGCDPGPSGGAAAATDRTAAQDPASEKVPAVCTGCVTEERLGQTVAVKAVVAHQCPARGCWFRMKDDAGEVMVDLGPGKLELAEDRVGQTANVTGKVVRKGGKLWLEARKVEFGAAGKDTPPDEKK